MKQSPNLCEFGKPNIACDEDIQPNDVDEKILDDDFIDKMTLINMTLIYIPGSYSEVILMEADTPKLELRLRCRVCGMKTKRSKRSFLQNFIKIEEH